MLRTFSLELTSLVNSDPAWKVPKGSRSASRRARKTVHKSLKDCTVQINRSSKSSNMPISGSEKRGASMSDCRFGDKAEHVPIKKRRLLFRASPSPPPPVIFPHRTEGTGNDTETHCALNKHSALGSATSDINSSKIVDYTNNLEAKKSVEVNRSFGEGDDFSGISILAAAACSSSLSRDCSDMKEGLSFEESSAQGQAREVSPTDAHLSTSGILKEDFPMSFELPTGGTSSYVGTEPVGQLVSISTTENSSQNVTMGNDAEHTSLKADPLTVSADVSCGKDEEKVGSQKQCSRDDRFHWDLNVMMDVWEDPLESPVKQNNAPCNACRDTGENSHDDNMEKTKVPDLLFKPATRFAAAESDLRGEPKTMANQSLEENKINFDINNCDHVVKATNSDDKALLSNWNRNADILSEDCKFMCHSRITKPTDGLVGTALNPSTQLPASGTKNEDDGVYVCSLKLNIDEHPKERPEVECLNLSTSGSHCKLENVESSSASDDTQPSVCVSSSSNIWIDVKPGLAIQGSMISCQELRSNIKAIAENRGVKTAEALEQPHVTSRGNNPSKETPLDTKEQDFDNSKGENLVCSDPCSLPKETCEVSHDSSRADLDKSANCFGKFDAAETLNRKNDGNVCCHPLSVVGSEAKIELQEYDSQYEDGEVRERDEHPWEGLDIVDREVEHVDYESDDIGASSINPTGYPVSRPGEAEDGNNCEPREAATVSYSVCHVVHEVGGEAGKPVEDCVCHEEESSVKLNSQSEDKLKESLSKEQLVGRSSSSDMDIGVSDDEVGKNRSASHADGFVDSKCAEIRVDSKAFRRGLQSRIEGPVPHDASSRAEQRSNRYEESSSIRSFDRTRYYHNQGRGLQADGWNNSPNNRRGTGPQFSPAMNRLSRLDDDSSMGRDDIGYIGVQDDVSYSHQLLAKGRSGGNEDDCPGLHSRYRPNRTFSTGRSATFGSGRSIGYGSVVENRVGRGRYNRVSPDDNFQSSLKYRRPLSLRERSVSPCDGRGHAHSRGKSPSQSRSRSPIIWNSPRGRTGTGSAGGTFVRHRSRSPNFGSDLRMQRPRSAHQQPGFGPDAMGFRSIPRNRGSPPHGRWDSVGKEEVGHFREFGYKQRGGGFKRSPGRIRVRGDRAGVYDPPRNLKTDGCYRISEDVSSRGPRCEENYDGRRKHYGPFRARHSYEDNMAERLRQDSDESFSLSKGIRDRDASDFQGRGFRGMDNRISDVPRRFRGEQRSFICEDGRFNHNSNQFGVHIMDSSQNPKSEEHYRSSHAGRFSNIDGVNRGRRYDYYDNRRKQYDPPNLMKHGDTDGSEKRLNHNLDENIQDASDFCGRPMRNFDCRVGGLSTRLREDKELPGRGQENKLEDNPQ